MSIWKKLLEIVEGPRDYSTGWRTNSVWDRAAELDRKPTPSDPKPQRTKGAPDGPIVWRGASMKDNDLFQVKNDKKTGKSMEAGLIPALKDAGGTITRAPDGSGMAVCPPGYKIDHTIWRDWSPTRSRAEVNAVTGGSPVQRNAYDLKGGVAGVRNSLPQDPDKGAGVTKKYDVLMQGRVQDNGGSQSIFVTKVVWAPIDRNSIEGQDPDARQAKLDVLMDTDDPSELAKMFPKQAQQTEPLGKPQAPADLPPNPLASPGKVQWTKGNAPKPAARPSAWDDIDLNKVPKKK